jgi:hypothetical protein
MPRDAKIALYTIFGTMVAFKLVTALFILWLQPTIHGFAFLAFTNAIWVPVALIPAAIFGLFWYRRIKVRGVERARARVYRSTVTRYTPTRAPPMPMPLCTPRTTLGTCPSRCLPLDDNKMVADASAAHADALSHDRDEEADWLTRRHADQHVFGDHQFSFDDRLPARRD